MERGFFNIERKKFNIRFSLNVEFLFFLFWLCRICIIRSQKYKKKKKNIVNSSFQGKEVFFYMFKNEI